MPAYLLKLKNEELRLPPLEGKHFKLIRIIVLRKSMPWLNMYHESKISLY